MEATLRRIDILVLEYLNRRCKPAANEFQQALYLVKTRLDPLQDLELSSTKLEDYVLRDRDELVSTNKIQAVKSDTSGLTLPNCPVEILCQVLSWMSVPDILRWRFLSRIWNHFACEALSRSPGVQSIQLTGEVVRTRFLDTMANRIQDTIPFSSYESPDALYEWEIPFISTLGQYITTLNIIIKKGFPLHPLCELLKETPSLREIAIYTLDPKLITFPAVPRLQKLRRLSIRPEMHQVISMSVLQSWIGLLPALEEVRCSYKIQVATELEMLEILKSVCHLRRFKVTFSHMQNHELYERQWNSNTVDWSFPTNLKLSARIYANSSSQLAQLVFCLAEMLETVETEWPIAGLEFSRGFSNLKHLHLQPSRNVVASVSAATSVNHKLFPAVKKVTLISTSRPLERFNLDGLGVLESVDTLFLKQPPYHPSDPQAPIGELPWHRMFPNVTSLTITHGMPNYLEYIVSFFPTLLHLHLIQIDEKHPLPFSRSWSWDSQMETWEWALGGLEGLKRFEVEISDERAWYGLHKPETHKLAIIALFELTRARKIQRLDYLGIYGKNPFGKLGRSLFATTNWHSKIGFNSSSNSFDPNW